MFLDNASWRKAKAVRDRLRVRRDQTGMPCVVHAGAKPDTDRVADHGERSGGQGVRGSQHGKISPRPDPHIVPVKISDHLKC